MIVILLIKLLITKGHINNKINSEIRHCVHEDQSLS